MSKYRFGQFELDLDSCELLKAGESIKLEPQVYCLLELLVLNYGHIVSRDEITKTVWDGRVVSQGTIDSRIKSLRNALGDDGRTQKIIKTYPNRGYRFVEQLEETCPQAEAIAKSKLATESENNAQHEIKPNIAGGRSKRSFLRKPYFLLLIAFLALFAFVITSMNRVSTMEASPADSLQETQYSSNVIQQSRIAVLPFKVIGSNQDMMYLPNILDSEFGQAVTAIQGISVVSIAQGSKLPEGIENPDAFAKALNLDYVLDPRVTFLEDLIFLRIDLLRASDNTILLSAKHEINIVEDAEELANWPSNSAISTIIDVANTLERPMNQRARYLTSYDFQRKLVGAQKLMVTDEYDDLTQAITLLKEAIADEPDYLPAYQSLYHAYWQRLAFARGDFEQDAREMLNLSASMEWISPNAPETLIVKATSAKMGIRGIAKTASGEPISNEWEDLINKAIASDPNNTMARTIKAYHIMSDGQRPFEHRLQAQDDALYFSPTDPSVLANYSRARLCNGELDEAIDLARSNIAWNPDSRKALNSIALVSSMTADYETAIDAMNTIIQKGWMQHDQTKTLRTLYFDLGVTEKALPYISFAPARAQVLAISGQAEQALIEADKIPEYYVSQIAKHIALNDNVTSDTYRPHPHYIGITERSDDYYANPCSLNYLAIDAHTLSSSDTERSQIFIALLEQYFSNRPLNDVRTSEEYLGLISLHILQDNQEKALTVLDQAIDQGFVFIDRFEEPVLSQLKQNPNIQARFDKMQTQVDDLLARIETSPL